MLLRHAKSDWSPSGMSDAARPLNERGETAARLMGGYMARHGLMPQRVLCSPSQRTRETLAGIASQWRTEVEAVYEERLYAATPQAILSVIQAQDSLKDSPQDDAPHREAPHTVLVIGHNPGLQEAAELLIAAGDVGCASGCGRKFPPPRSR